MHSQKWKNNNIVEALTKVQKHEEKIKIIKMKNSVKILGVYIIPLLSWKDEFEHVKHKMKLSIKRLMKSCMKMNQVCLYFNTHVLTNLFFGCAIVNFSKKQYDELKQTYELPIMRQMKLGDNLPRRLLHVSKSVL